MNTLQHTNPRTEIDGDVGRLTLKERIDLFSKPDGENEKVGLPASFPTTSSKALNNALSTALSIVDQVENSPEESADLKLTQNRLARVDDRLSKLTSTLGQKAFASEEFHELLEERDDCLDILSKAGITPETISKANSETKSRRPRLTRRRSNKVSAQRLRELHGKYEPEEFTKTTQDEDIIRGELRRNFIFKKVQDAALEDLLKAFEPIQQYKRGDAIIQQGDIVEFFYILGKGSVVYEANGDKVESSNKPGTSFGEVALLYQCPHEMTIRADSDDMRVYRVDQVTFRYILQSRSKFKALGMQAVTKVKAANRLLSMAGLNSLSSHHRRFEISDSDDDSSTSDQSEYDELEPATGDRDDPSRDFMDLAQKRRSIRSSISESSVSVNNFRRSSLLGEGQFGEVWLVQPDIEEIDKEQFALKIQSKEEMGREAIEYSAEEAIKRECDALSAVVHPFIVDLVCNFEDEENIYMVMGAIKGKELWECVHREQENGEWISGISEEHTRFYGAVIADTLNYMHQQHVCHRDIKPENVMINGQGYPILVDFGFAKILSDDTTYTLCGTPKYTAPEIITNEGHGCAVDFWALGVLIYEMLSGENPWYYDGLGDLQLFDDICNHKPHPIQDDVDCSEDVRDIIMKLVEKDPKTRLVGKAVTSHSWFEHIDFRKARKMELQAPEPM